MEQGENVQTAAGPVAASSLGGVLIGERLVGAPAGHAYWPAAEDESAAALDHVRRHVAAAAAAGVGTIVDVTPIDGGRDLGLFAAAGASIVFSTGLGPASDGIPPAFRALDSVSLGAVYARELTDGVPGTGLRAGVIAVSVGPTFDPFDDTAILAAAFAHAETGAPVVAQAPPERILALVEQLVGRGIDPERVVATGLDHPDASWAVVDGVARLGALLGFTSPGDVVRRAAAITYGLRRYGPSRICLARGTPYWERPVPGAGEESTSPGLQELLDAVSSFGIEQPGVQELLRVAAGALFAPLPEASVV